MSNNNVGTSTHTGYFNHTLGIVELCAVLIVSGSTIHFSGGTQTLATSSVVDRGQGIRFSGTGVYNIYSNIFESTSISQVL